MNRDELAARGVRVKALIEAYWRLRGYAVHDDGCKLNKPPRFSGPCSCGLTTAIKAGEWAADMAEVAEAGPTEYERKVAQMKEVEEAYKAGHLIAPTPAALATSPEVQAMLAEERARGMERGMERAAVIADRHLSKVEINEPLWHEGQDWAAESIALAIRAEAAALREVKP